NGGALVDILAPGFRIESLALGGGTQTRTGTSMAAPHVAGTAALMRQLNPTLTPSDVMQRLAATGVMVTDDRTGLPHPRLDIGAVVCTDDLDDDGEVGSACGGVDCNDDEADIFTGAAEVFYDGIDQNCDGASDFDADGDGFDSDAFGGLDCDDTQASVSPASQEIWYDGFDQNCDGRSDFDQDGDGFDSDVFGGADCNDLDEAIAPDG
ncbi:MAG: MopE-related protein, partial [Myxococcota bacterium]